MAMPKRRMFAMFSIATVACWIAGACLLRTSAFAQQPIFVAGTGPCAVANPAQCPDCNGFPVPAFGCSAPAPLPWWDGSCSQYTPQVCTDWTNYNCGFVMQCGAGNIGQPCGQANVCK